MGAIGPNDLIISDRGNHSMRLLHYNTTAPAHWELTTVMGGPPPTPSPGFVDGNDSAARFSYPVGLAVASPTLLYLADTNNSAIRKLQRVGNTWQVSTQWKINFNDLPTDATTLPASVALDPSATHLYFTAPYFYAGSLAQLDLATNTLTAVVGKRSDSSALNAGLGPGTLARFGTARGLAVASPADIFVADYSVVRQLHLANGIWTV